ncbi:MAG: hypothetical protein LBQ04_02745 [Endomicrobium sp.]|jgi:hypothetical protein|nr:hypothetical protein [Endomicrobium sp.]
MNKYFLVILFFLLCFYKISNGGQSITVQNTSIDGVYIAGNGDPFNNGKYPFNNTLQNNSLTCKNINIFNGLNICGCLLAVDESIDKNLSFNVLNIEGTLKSDASINLTGSLDLESSNLNNNNEVNILEGTTILAEEYIRIAGAQRLTSNLSFNSNNLFNNKAKLLPYSKLSSKELFISGVFVVLNSIPTITIAKNIVSIGEGCVLEVSSSSMSLCGVMIESMTDDFSTVNVADNIVTILKDVTLNANGNEISILGVSFSNSTIIDSFSSLILANNTLNFHANREYKVTRVGNFTKYNFFLYEGIKNNNTVLSFDSGQNLASSDTVQPLNLNGVNIDIEMTKEIVLI